MRLAEKEVRSGYFWMPAKPDDKLPGTLTLSNGGDIRLEVLGIFGGNPFDDAPIPRIVGVIEGGKLVTLDECFYTTRNLSDGGLSKSHVFVHRALIGDIALDADEPILLDHLRFSVDGLESWLGTTGLKLTHDRSDGSLTISYRTPPNTTIEIDDTWRVTIGFAWTASGGPQQKEARVAETAHLTVEAVDSKPLDEFIRVAHKLTNFLAFAIDSTVSISSVTGRVSESVSPETRSLRVVFKSISFSEQVPQTEWFRMLFLFPHVRDTAAEKLQKWLRAYDKYQPTLALYFASRTGAYGFVNGRFLALAQALETYHRRTSDEPAMEWSVYRVLALSLLILCPPQYRSWLEGKLQYGNELSLANRLRRLISPFEKHMGDSASRAELVKKIAATRNYLTHYDRSLKSRAVHDGSELYSLCMKMEVLLQLHFLREIGFSMEEIDGVITRHHAIQAKLKGHPV